MGTQIEPPERHRRRGAAKPLRPSEGELFSRLAELSGVERDAEAIGLGFAAGDAFEAVDHEGEFVEVDAVELGGIAAEGACGCSGAAPIAGAEKEDGERQRVVECHAFHGGGSGDGQQWVAGGERLP
jgi:hypothetical protein